MFRRQRFPPIERPVALGESKAPDRAGVGSIRSSCRIHLLLAVLVLALASGCATPRATPPDHAAFHDLGELEGERIDQAVRRVLVRDCGFSLARRSQQFATVYYETGWKERTPLSEERVLGVKEARTRLLIRGQRAEGGRYRTVLEGENEIRTDSLPDWSSARVTRDFVTWMDRLADRLVAVATAPSGSPDPAPADGACGPPSMR